MKISHDTISLDTPAGKDEETHLADFIENFEAEALSDPAVFSLLQKQLQIVWHQKYIKLFKQ